MSRWRITWGVGLLSSIFILFFHSSDPSLLTDSDTRTLLTAVQARHAPLSWFWSDWPLGNHFYRPLPTLTFIVDHKLYGNWAGGYGWTNAWIAAWCVFMFCWLLRELLDNPLQTALGTVLFALWQTEFPSIFLSVVNCLAFAVLLIGGVRHRKNWKAYFPAFLSLLFLEELLIPWRPLEARVIDWLPGRTATTMTFFALVAMAAYARYERTGKPISRKSESLTSMDRPATKSSKYRKQAIVPRNFWIGVSIVATIGAFASYEQAVMLPACLLGLAVYFRMIGQKVNWLWQVAFWGILVGYFGVRHAVIPSGVSSYQAQQLKSSLVGPFSVLSEMLFPPIGTISQIKTELEGGAYVLFDPQFYANLAVWVIFLVGTYQLRRTWKLALTGWLLAFIAFLPMAFVKEFAHYFYWPQALQVILVVAAGITATYLSLIAVSPPAIQAPSRLDPAPGSLHGQ